MRRRLPCSVERTLAFGALVIVASCLREKDGERSASGAIDTAAPVPSISAITPATGPGVQVTRTDASSVRLATQYKLTNENFAKFVRAADSVASLEGRDASVRARLETPIADAASPELDAGAKWLESDPAVVRVINAAGLSSRDYFVMAIVIAGAEQHLAKPSSAPPTPAAQQNAEFLRGKAADLAHLHALERAKPGVVVVP